MTRTRLVVLLLVGAAAVLVSAWVHFYLYFRGGYRGIAPESFLGITVSRAFVVNAIAGVVIAEALVLATRFERLVMPAAAHRRALRARHAGRLLPVARTTRCSASTRPK